jgi:hypothetical protein
MTELIVDSETRDSVADCRRALPESSPGGKVVFGFDGYLDTMRELRQEASAGAERITSLEVVGDRILEAVEASSSLSLGWQESGRRAGGHVCHLGRAYDTLGYDPTLVGTLGDPVQPFFEERFGHLSLHSLGEPGKTQAVEFNDGKLLLTESGDIENLDWEWLLDRVGRDTLAAALDGAQVLGIGYWAMVVGLPEILDGLREQVWPTLADPPEWTIVDPADIRRLASEDIDAVAEATERFATVTDLTLSANGVETRALAEAVSGQAGEETTENARRLFESLDVARVVSHGARQSCCVSADGTTTVSVEPVDEPALTTGAGDHFNAGFSLGLCVGLSESAALVTGNALARRFVATGQTPDYEELTAAVGGYLDQFA